MRRYNTSPPRAADPYRTRTFDGDPQPPPTARHRHYYRRAPLRPARRCVVTRTRPEQQYPVFTTATTTTTTAAATAAKPTTYAADASYRLRDGGRVQGGAADDDDYAWLRRPPPPPPIPSPRSRSALRPSGYLGHSPADYRRRRYSSARPEPYVVEDGAGYSPTSRRRRRSRWGDDEAGGDDLGFAAPDVRSGVGATRPVNYAEEVTMEWPAEGEGSWLGFDEKARMRYDDFALSRRDRSFFGVLASDDGDREGEEEGENGKGEIEETKEQREDETRLKVLFSEWLDNGSGGEDPVAELVVEPDVGVMRKRKRRKGLFEWLHLKQDVMNFEVFTRRVEHASELSDEQKKWTVKLLKGISRQFEKPLLTQAGIQGRWMIPNFDQELRDGSNLPTVNFLCFPFFTLEKYGPPVLPEESRAHPKRTLLQTLFSSASRAQDFQQAVTQLPNTPKDCLFHVRQLWALIVDDNFMITCSSEEPSTMVNDSVNITSQPSFGISSANSSGPGYIEVSDGGLNVWLLPLDRCKSWFLFASNLYGSLSYGEEGMEDIDVTYEGTALSEEDWPKLLEKAHRTTVRLEVRRKTARLTTRIPTIAVAGETDEDSDTLVSESSENPLSLPKFDVSKDQFHIFTWISNSERKDDQSARTTRLKRALEEVQKLLLRESHPRDRRAYKTAFLEGKRNNVSYQSVKRAVESLSADTKEDQEWQRSLAVLFRDLVAIFQFFLPLDCTAPVACCFWAALQRMIESSRISELPQLTEISTYAQRLTYISEKLTDLDIPRPSRENPPDDFVIAWIHFSLAVCHWNLDDMAAFNHHLESSEQKIVEALPKFLRSFQDKPLEERAAAMPLSILSLVVQELLMDLTGARPDVMTSYWDYYNHLNRRVDEDPLNRDHQKSINFLKQEIDAIKATLNQQLNVLKDFSRALDQRGEAVGDYTDFAYSVEPIVVENGIAAVDAKLRSFEDMRLAAADLQATNLQMIDSNKDRQEAAVYAFTIVTIIFLPLSFVSGFLGMNTADIRDMPYQQWVFWAAGIPLTLLIIFLGLLWAGELGNVYKGCLGLLDGRRMAGGMGGRGDGVGPFAYSENVVDAPGGDGNEEAGVPRRKARGGLVRKGTLASSR